MSEAMVSLQGLSKEYKNKQGKPICVVRNIDLEIPAGKVLAFLGPNGAGKTTTIKMICGLIKPTSGKVYIDGLDAGKLRTRVMPKIGAVLEGTRNIHWALSIWDNLMYFGHLKGCGGKSLKERGQILLKQMELWRRKNDLVRTLSRGMQQKVAIACALVADPSLLLLDEPTLGLDVKTARNMKLLIKRLAQDQGKTIVLTTHRLDMAQELCDNVAIINRGSIISHGSADMLLSIHQDAYYDIEYILEDTAQIDIQVPDYDLKIEKMNDHYRCTGTGVPEGQVYDVLDVLHYHGAQLISVQKRQPTLEEIFIHMVDLDMREVAA